MTVEELIDTLLGLVKDGYGEAEVKVVSDFTGWNPPWPLMDDQVEVNAFEDDYKDGDPLEAYLYLDYDKGRAR